MTATNFFPSRKRCCDQCCQRRIKVGDRELTEYYHRGVVAHLIGAGLPVVLDVEMIGPGDAEIVAARRLFERVLGRYGRFFDAVVGDAIYFEAPLFELCRARGKHLLAVLKENNPALLTDARALMAGEPDLIREDGKRIIRYWDEQDLRSGSVTTGVRVVRAEETTHTRERIANQWVEHDATANWFWATSIPSSLMPARQIAQAGHERWSIENRIFNSLSAHWGLDHCFRHDPAAILNFILILFIAHTLVAAFGQLNLKPQARRGLTLIGVAAQLLLGIAAWRAGETAPWLRHCGHAPP